MLTDFEEFEDATSFSDESDATGRRTLKFWTSFSFWMKLFIFGDST
jgi:hypothetical protein